MPRPNTARERRADILAAAIRVLAREGLSEATTRKIAAEASVNQAMLGYYFGSKDDLLFAVLQEMIRATEQIVRSALPVGVDLAEAIAGSLTAFWEHVEAEPELEILQYELTLYALRRPESAWLARQQYDGYAAVVETLIAEAFAVAGVECPVPSSSLARFLIAGLDGLMLQFISDRDTTRARRDLELLIAAVGALVQTSTYGARAEREARSAGRSVRSASDAKGR
ncbi:MAG TPA: TetR/AcrR family transcriptional regulator [Ktedonobacterales bacterium]|nr:TetR/AcrR family transcriptional regulator [Ktedonobacterales bacterium]